MAPLASVPCHALLHGARGQAATTTRPLFGGGCPVAASAGRPDFPGVWTDATAAILEASLLPPSEAAASCHSSASDTAKYRTSRMASAARGNTMRSGQTDLVLAPHILWSTLLRRLTVPSCLVFERSVPALRPTPAGPSAQLRPH